MVLKKEMMKTQNKDLEKAAEYRQLLVQAIHSCAVRFPDVAGTQDPVTPVSSGSRCVLTNSAVPIHAGSVLHLLMDFVSDSNTASALDVVYFIREITEVQHNYKFVLNI